jgi:hypothetical protein
LDQPRRSGISTQRTSASWSSISVSMRITVNTQRFKL